MSELAASVLAFILNTRLALVYKFLGTGSPSWAFFARNPPTKPTNFPLNPTSLLPNPTALLPNLLQTLDPASEFWLLPNSDWAVNFRELGSYFHQTGKSILGTGTPLPRAGSSISGNWDVNLQDPGSQFPGTGKSISGNREVNSWIPGNQFPGTGKSIPGNRITTIDIILT